MISPSCLLQSQKERNNFQEQKKKLVKTLFLALKNIVVYKKRLTNFSSRLAERGKVLYIQKFLDKQFLILNII